MFFFYHVPMSGCDLVFHDKKLLLVSCLIFAWLRSVIICISLEERQFSLIKGQFSFERPATAIITTLADPKNKKPQSFLVHIKTVSISLEWWKPFNIYYLWNLVLQQYEVYFYLNKIFSESNL